MEIEKIYRDYFYDIFRFLLALSENESLSEELTQETFVKVLKNIDQFDGRKDIRAWLFTIARNTYYRHCRRNSIFVGEEFLDNIQDPAPQTVDLIIERENIERIEYNACKLQEPYRQVFNLRIYGNLSFEQIGNLHGKSAGWARVTYYRARKMIQSKMDKGK